MSKYNFKESDCEYLHEIIGVVWNDNGDPYLNGVKLTEENLLELLEGELKYEAKN